MSPPNPRTLGRYELQEEIGRGMMGIVYRALDPELHRTVALKTVHLAWAIGPEDRELFEQRFMNEARVAAGLSHPGIVVVHDVGRDPTTGTVYIALEFLEGKTLGALTADGKALEWREALRIGARVAEALHHAHERGVVHRDVKPANVMVLPSGEPKLMDFGIAKMPASQLTAAGEFFGTPSYMSPEQAASGTVDGRSDLFSLGSVLYLMLTGRRAFDANGVAAILTRVVLQDPVLPSRVVADLPADVDYVIARALAKEPAFRYPDGRSFAEDLTDVAESLTPRHRATWTEPKRTDGTMPADLALTEAETTDLRKALRPTLPGAAPTLRAGTGRRVWLVTFSLLMAGAIALLLIGRRPEPHVAVVTPAGTSMPPSTTEAPATTPPPTTEPAATSFWPPHVTLTAPARLAFELEHGIREGRLKLFSDEDLLLEKDLGAPVTKKIVFYKMRKQVLRQSFDLPAGSHVLRVQVAMGGEIWSERIKGDFESGKGRKLVATFGGIIGKELELVWGESPAP